MVVTDDLRPEATPACSIVPMVWGVPATTLIDTPRGLKQGFFDHGTLTRSVSEGIEICSPR